MDISILVVDDDVTSLSVIAKILTSWEYKVLTAKSARCALTTLQQFEGFFDLVVMELHLHRMNGFELQKIVKNEYQLPIITMSADKREKVMSKSLELGAAHFITKPVCTNDFKNIWQYAMVARKAKLVPEKIELKTREDSIAASSLFTETERKGKYNKRKSSEMTNNEERSSRFMKKSKVIWTASLHNQFLLAIKHFGLDRAVPKKILEYMNVPYLTRENVASHLQKYRIFVNKIAEKGMLEGLSDRAFRSKFASGIPSSLLKNIQTRSQNLRSPVQQNLRRLAQSRGTTNSLIKPSNQVPFHLLDQQFSSNSYTTPSQKGLMLQNRYNDSLNQMRLGEPKIGSNNIEATNNNVPPKFLGYGLMTAANSLMGGNQNYGSFGNHNNNNFNYGLGNWNMESLSGSDLPSSSKIYFPSSTFSGAQLSGGSILVGNGIKEGGLNSFGLNNNNETENAIMSSVTPLSHGNFGLTYGSFALDKASNVDGNEGANEIQAPLINNGIQEGNNNLGIQQSSQQLVSSNVTQNVNQFKDDDELLHLDDDLSHFLVLDDMNLLNEIEENPNNKATEVVTSDSSNSGQIVGLFGQQQTNKANNVTTTFPKSTISNLPSEFPTISNKIPNRVLGNDEIGDCESFVSFDSFDSFLMDDNVVSSANNSAVDKEKEEHPNKKATKMVISDSSSSGPVVEPLGQTVENPNNKETKVVMSNPSSSGQVVEPLGLTNKAVNMTPAFPKSTILNLSNESATISNKVPNLVLGDDEIGDCASFVSFDSFDSFLMEDNIVSSANNSAVHKETGENHNNRGTKVVILDSSSSGQVVEPLGQVLGEDEIGDWVDSFLMDNNVVSLAN